MRELGEALELAALCALVFVGWFVLADKWHDQAIRQADGCACQCPVKGTK